jgi:uncharacterized protein
VSFNSNAHDHRQSKIYPLPFKPFSLLKNAHLQTIVSSFSFAGATPPSKSRHITLEDGDVLSCEVSTPPSWNNSQKTVFLVHGLTGSHESNYMIRVARKMYHSNYKVVRINLRGCGSGKGLAKKPYHSGKSDDILFVLQSFKKETPNSPFVLIGFSVGGNLALKLAGELKSSARDLLEQTIAVCPPVDLAKCLALLATPPLKIYHDSYVQNLKKYGEIWLQNIPITSIYDFDHLVTVPLWGFENTADFYKKCSSCNFLSQIDHPCHIIFAADDPMIYYESVLEQKIPDCVKVWLSPKGGHMGFLGGGDKKGFWLDSLLLSWV